MTAITLFHSALLTSFRGSFRGILTYGGRGTAKPNVNAHEHAIIYTNGRTPTLIAGEKALSTKPIKVTPSSPQHRLDEAARLNYEERYSIDFTEQVWFIGQVDPSSDKDLRLSYNEFHPPLRSREQPAPSDVGTKAATYAQVAWINGTGTYAVPRTSPSTVYAACTPSYSSVLVEDVSRLPSHRPGSSISMGCWQKYPREGKRSCASYTRRCRQYERQRSRSERRSENLNAARNKTFPKR